MIDLTVASSAAEIASGGHNGAAVRTILTMVLGAMLALLGPLWMSIHDRRERRIERMMRLRKDTFMGAIEAATSSQEALGRMAGAVVTGDEARRNQVAEEVRGAAGAMARVDLVGNLETIAAFSRVQETLRREWFALTSRGLALVPLESEIRDLKAGVESLESRHSQIVSALGSIKGEERARFERFAAPHLIQLAEEIQQTRQNLSQRQVELATRRLELTLSLAPAVMNIGTAITEATLAARHELDIDLQIDRHDFRRLIEGRGKSAAEDFSKFEEDLRRNLGLPKEADEA